MWDTASMLAAIQASDVAQAVKKAPGLYPFVNTVHVLAIGVLIGSMVVLDLLLLGFGRAVPIDAAEPFLRRIAGWGFLFAVISGLLLFSAEAVALSKNQIFLTKLGLLAAALANAGLFIVLWRGDMSRSADNHRFWSQLQAGASLFLWISVASAGRLIAYY
jgi:hypothetical protein